MKGPFLVIFILLIMPVMAQQEDIIQLKNGNTLVPGKEKTSESLFYHEITPQGKKVGKVKFFRDSIVVSTYFRNEEIVKSKYSALFTDGRYIPHGRYYSFSTRGDTLSAGFFDSGAVHGKWKIFYPSGRLNKVENYYFGKKDGSFKEFFPSGKLKSEGLFRESSKTGLWKNYHPNGVLMSAGYYFPGHKKILLSEEDKMEYKNLENGTIKNPYIIYFKEGTWEYYNSKGVLVRKEFYKEGFMLAGKEFDPEEKNKGIPQDN